ncbi:MAG: hypothetical protein C0506_12415 [Anaerolinea sp.]|nr:hypothetical protein [Anaerolinea sp.]
MEIIPALVGQGIVVKIRPLLADSKGRATAGLRVFPEPGSVGRPMASSASPRRGPSRSTLLAGLFVLVAGGIAWSGAPTLGARPAKPAAATLTLGGASRPASDASGAPVPLIERGGLPTRLVIPAAGIDTVVSEVGVVLEDGKPVWETAWRSAGHHLDSALPGQAGNMVISGHVSVADRSNVAVFRTLDAVGAGDVIEVYSGDSIYRYAVKTVSIAPPSAVRFLRSSQSATVTLITCTRDLKNRLVVVGTLI